jgi:hypothetical protein
MDVFAEKLKSNFPILYRQMGVPWQSGGMIGFHIGKGWFDLIYDLSSKIEPLLVQMKNPPFAIQVKEKFGGLRFYLGGKCEGESLEEIYNFINLYQSKSLITCENCGEKGNDVELGYWLKTLCLDCFEKYKADRLMFRHGEFKNV